MISNRPQLLEDNLPFYNHFPARMNLDVDYKELPPLLNLDWKGSPLGRNTGDLREQFFKNIEVELYPD